LYIHTHCSPPSPKELQRYLRYPSETLAFYKNDMALRNTTDVTGCKPVAVRSESISGVGVVNPLGAFYDIHGRKREVLFFYSVPDTTQDL
jgi:hypothetical protein